MLGAEEPSLNYRNYPKNTDRKLIEYYNKTLVRIGAVPNLTIIRTEGEYCLLPLYIIFLYYNYSNYNYFN